MVVTGLAQGRRAIRLRRASDRNLILRAADTCAADESSPYGQSDITRSGRLRRSSSTSLILGMMAKVCLLIALPCGALARERVHASSLEDAARDRTNRRWEDATRPPSETLPRLSVTEASAGLVFLVQAYWNINRDDVETIPVFHAIHTRRPLPSYFARTSCRASALARSATLRASC
jgi:hypothetical protein